MTFNLDAGQALTPSSEDVANTLSYVKKLTGKTILVKIGGSVLLDQKAIESLCEDLALIRAVGISVVLVHGGGPAINEELTLRGIKWEFHNGLRITTPQMMTVIEMVLCGKINQQVVRTLNAAGVPAVGLSGVDANLLLCKRFDPKLGEVGEVQSVNGPLLEQTLKQTPSVMPVIAPVGIDEQGLPLNVNADWAATKIAQALGVGKIIYLTDQEGILDGEGKLISELDAAELNELIKTGVVKGGMLAKAKTILDALKNNVRDVHIINPQRPRALLEELFTSRGIGTVCRVRSRQ